MTEYKSIRPYSENRDQLIDGEIAAKFLSAALVQQQLKRPPST